MVQLIKSHGARVRKSGGGLDDTGLTSSRGRSWGLEKKLEPFIPTLPNETIGTGELNSSFRLLRKL